MFPLLKVRTVFELDILFEGWWAGIGFHHQEIVTTTMACSGGFLAEQQVQTSDKDICGIFEF